MRTLDDIRNNPTILMYLRWDMDQARLAKTKFNQEDAGFYFCIYVSKYSRAYLALLHYYPDGKATQECIDGFPEDTILEAAKEAGAYIDENKHVIMTGPAMAGTYLPINKTTEGILRARLAAAGRDATKYPLSQMTRYKLTEALFDLLNELHGGDYYNRFNEIVKERGSKATTSTFFKLDAVSLQLLIEKLQELKDAKGKKEA